MGWINETGVDYEGIMDDLLGFIYIIKLTDGRKYVGRKQFWSKRGRDWYESNWREYLSSSKEILAGLEDGTLAIQSRSIIGVYSSKSAIRYAETAAIVLSKSYNAFGEGLNGSFENCRGRLALTDLDVEQIENLYKVFREGLEVPHVKTQQIIDPRPVYQLIESED